MVNLLPVFGVINWGWDLASLLYLYWVEGLFIGLFNVAKILRSNPQSGGPGFSALFFSFHYGVFWIVHGVFLIAGIVPKMDITNPSELSSLASLSAINLRWVILSFLIFHALSYVKDFLTIPRDERRDPITQMFVPYGRVFVMHAVILVGAFHFASEGREMGILLLFTALKIIFDLFTYMVFDRRKGAV